jgi:hypothetical protein
MITFALTHLVLFVLLGFAAWGAGSIVARRLDCTSVAGLVAIRCVAGLATLGLVLFAFGVAGVLGTTASAVLLAISAAAGVARWRDLRGLHGEPATAAIGALLVFAPLFVLALYPPIAFDETLYHLPTVERFAATESLPFIAHLRFPVFPHLDEVLRVPLFQFGGDVATHLLSLLATLVTAGLLLAWFGERSDPTTGWLAAALFLSAPLVTQLATTGYVEALQTMFVAAAFYAFDRWRASSSVAWLVASGAFAGCSAAVKYLGLLWVAVLALGVLQTRKSRVSNTMLFACAAVLALTPWYGRVVAFTGNPIFPFGSGLFGSSVWGISGIDPRSWSERIVGVMRLPWDVLFARERAGFQPPFSPFLVALIPFVAYRALRDSTVRALAAVVMLYGAMWALPLASAAAALASRGLFDRFSIDTKRAVAIVAIVLVLPGPLYALHRIQRNGAIPMDEGLRVAWLARQVPEYGAIEFVNARSTPEDVSWFCGGENLPYHVRGTGIGDHWGPARFDLLASARDEIELDRRAASLGARYLLVVKRSCAIPALDPARPSTRFTRVYDDATVTIYERNAR